MIRSAFTMTTTKRQLTASQQQALARMPELADSVFPQVRDSLPADSYIDPARFDEEKTAVFRSAPVLVGPSALLAQAGSYFQQDIAGMPVLVTRNKEGQVKAFANVCRHRGAKLCTSADPVKGARIVCPYHAWTYNLEGTLIGLPRQETFPGIEKKELGLTALPCVEAGGLIWIGLDPEGKPDFSVIETEVGADLDAVGLEAMRIYNKTTFAVKANWKLVMDTMLDSYHVTRLHKDSLARFFVDAENIIDCMGPHVRAAAARGNFEKNLVTDDFADVRKIMVFAYTLFPNGIVVVSPDFVSVGILRPLATDRTDVDYYMLTDVPENDEKMNDKLRRSFDLMNIAFGQEDYWAAELCDAGLRSGTLKEVQLGGMEIQISLFHNAVNQCLEQAKAASCAA
jgi:phenylpropionate dioxygenase-like ring-hydroxylating dioxygenase large terminal subunit